MMILLNRKVRDRAPETPVCPEVVQECARRGPGRPKGNGTVSGAKVMREDVGGVKQESFRNLPVELWNQLSAIAVSWLRQVATELDDAYSSGVEAQTVSLLDQTLPEAALSLGRASMEALATQERGFHGSRLVCHECAGTLEYQGDVVKSKVKTRIGDISLKRCYYHGPCGHSVCPLDRLLGLDGEHDVMPSLQDTVAWMTASMSYPEAVKVLEKLCPSKFSLKVVETITATIAAQVQDSQQEEIRAVLDDPSAAARRDGDLVPGVVVLEADGGFVRVRDHTEPSREFKLAVLGTLDEVRPLPAPVCPLPGEVDRKIKLVDKSFVGHFAGPDRLYDHVTAEYFRRGFHQFKTLHGIGDGGVWVLPRMTDLAQEGQELSLVLDWWHADERVAQIAAVLYGAGTPDAQQWRETLRAALWDDRLDDFFAGLKQAILDADGRSAAEVSPERKGGRASAADKTVQEALQEQYNYFDSRRHLLRYKECRERGLPIGSGAIEGGIRFIGKDRLDQTGMRWNISGAEDILQLRTIKYSHRWDELAEKRAKKRRTRYESARSAWTKAA